MSTYEIVVSAALLVAQLVSLKVIEHRQPRYYFTAASFFDRQSQVSGRAVLWRLSIPAAGGVTAGLVVNDHSYMTGVTSSVLCWFLAVWPIVWNPSLAPHPLVSRYGVMILSFGVAFGVLSAMGVKVGVSVLETFHGEGSELQSQLVWGAVVAAFFGGVVKAMTKLASFSLSFKPLPKRDSQRNSFDHTVPRSQSQENSEQTNGDV